MGKIEWAVWANEHAVVSASVLVLGGLVGCFHPAGRSWPLLVYSVVFGVLVFLFEYPRARKTEKSKGRKYQEVLIPYLNQLGLLSRNYFVRFTGYMILLTPCYFSLPTLMGSSCLFLAGILYLIAAIKGEEWQAVKPSCSGSVQPDINPSASLEQNSPSAVPCNSDN